MLYDKKWDKSSNKKLDPDPGQRVCLEAAQYIRENGWCQWQLTDGSGRVCLIGAISLSSRHKDVSFHSAWGKVQPLIGINLDLWNDQPGRTKEEVIALLEQAAAIP